MKYLPVIVGSQQGNRWPEQWEAKIRTKNWRAGTELRVGTTTSWQYYWGARIETQDLILGKERSQAARNEWGMHGSPPFLQSVLSYFDLSAIESLSRKLITGLTWTIAVFAKAIFGQWAEHVKRYWVSRRTDALI